MRPVGTAWPFDNRPVDWYFKSMKTVGIFEAKAKLSEICERVASNKESVLITKRGKPLVRIDPLEETPMTISEARAVYMAKHGDEEKAERHDLEPPERSREPADFELGD